MAKTYEQVIPRAERDKLETALEMEFDHFEAMNDIGNNKSLAHDNPQLIDPDEARF